MAFYDVKDRVVVITGGAGGLGQALAVALRARGARLALLDMELAAANAAARQIGSSDVARGWAADVRDYERLVTVLGEVEAHFGRIDVVIANAGVAMSPAPVTDLDVEQFVQGVDINLNGVFRTLKAAIPHVVKTGGYLLATSSMAAFVHMPLAGYYPASKAGVWGFCNTLRGEMAHQGVAVGSLHPTFFMTPMLARVREGGASTSQRYKLMPIEVVVEQTLRGIARRSKHIFAPASMGFFARIPFFAQARTEKRMLSGPYLRDAIAAARARKPANSG